MILFRRNTFFQSFCSVFTQLHETPLDWFYHFQKVHSVSWDAQTLSCLLLLRPRLTDQVRNLYEEQLEIIILIHAKQVWMHSRTFLLQDWVPRCLAPHQWKWSCPHMSRWGPDLTTRDFKVRTFQETVEQFSESYLRVICEKIQWTLCELIEEENQTAESAEWPAKVRTIPFKTERMKWNLI